jgi:L-ribulose-5-phosphate 4-epimerase
MSEEVRGVVANAARVLGAADHGDLVWGHVSARDPRGRGVWLKASGWGLEEVTPERVHLVDAGGRVLEGDGRRHKEYPIHTEIMAARADVGGVVHTHSPYCVALAAAGQPLRPVGHAGNYFVPPEVPRFTDTGDLILTRELGRKLAAVLGDAPAAFMVNHGIVTVGKDVPTAVVAAILLEQAARQQLLAQSFGGWITSSDPVESLSKRANIYSEDAIAQVWQYLVRRLGDGGEHGSA